MIEVEHISVMNFENAIRGCRNPMNSWDRSDSHSSLCDDTDCCECIYDINSECQSEYGYVVGKNDLDLMRRLYKGGAVHRKYLRQIFVSMDINAPLYWWKEFDTYKVGTTSNSCSTMHKIHSKEFTLKDFSCEHLTDQSLDILKKTIHYLNYYRCCFNDLETATADKRKEYWYQMIQLLPSSYNQKRTVTMTYENIMNMIDWRENHKLDEWRGFVLILKCLPYIEEIRGRSDDTK